MKRMSKKVFAQTHREYQKSDHWKSLKQKCLNYYNNICCLCGTESIIHKKHKTFTIHHLNYKNKFKEIIGSDVILICNSCHFKIYKKIIKLWKKHYYRYNPKYPPLNYKISPKEQQKRKQFGDAIRKEKNQPTFIDPRYGLESLGKSIPIMNIYLLSQVIFLISVG